ncbi:uncharacterized protein SPSC_02362 [Sporisorium scitamineum]|uniref:Uncharacterized protein n=1 Tax=Sporisorium scitamineum TaxID=49012 RepID=A0A0F7RZC5_9BASI|nr:hypothetical protein [Sporisorium scitamineum]CDU23733.1 uncharacterized protein SPSC_02362 [Sporisorium scitamineum]
MLFNSKSLTSALVAMVSLSIAVSASLDPIEQHLATRDTTAFQPSKEAAGKLATPVDLGKTPVAPQAVFKLTGQDLHSTLPNTNPGPSSFEQSDIAVPGQNPPADLTKAGDDANKAHCYLGHATASIKRIRYTMNVQIDRDESGATTVAKADSVHGVVIKATSGLYSNSNPDQGSCAKTLARHGEMCANRPYIVPQSILPQGSPNGAAGAGAGAGTGDDKNKLDPKVAKYHAGPLVTKRSSEVVTLESDSADEAAHLVFKRDTEAKPAPDTNPVDPIYKTETTVSGTDASITGPAGTVCIDTVKRDKEVTKVVPTKATPKTTPQSGAEPLHFELVRRDEKSNVWNQIIYDAHGKVVDVTHLSLTSDMKFFRAEYLCESCKPGHQKHTVLYENVEIEVDALHESALPTVQCQGQAQSTNVHKRDKSRYAKKNGSGINYTGLIFAIDRVTLGVSDGKGHGGAASVTEGQFQPVSGEIPAKQTPAVEESKEDGKPKPEEDKPKPVKRDVVAEADGPIF